jgi:hypothetical protein
MNDAAVPDPKGGQAMVAGPPMDSFYASGQGFSSQQTAPVLRKLRRYNNQYTDDPQNVCYRKPMRPSPARWAELYNRSAF